MAHVTIFECSKYIDSRGTFSKAFDASKTGVENFSIKQVNHVSSEKKYTLRGLHYQTSVYEEAKFFKVLRGAIQLAWVDLSILIQGKQNAGASQIIDSDNLAILVPRGFATGYLTLEDSSEVLYFSDNIYSPLHERGLRWNDRCHGIKWLCDNPIMSTKDNNWHLIEDKMPIK
jgi:dTDP-4-dehydrorhamnose 3,5-epimerase